MAYNDQVGGSDAVADYTGMGFLCVVFTSSVSLLSADTTCHDPGEPQHATDSTGGHDPGGTDGFHGDWFGFIDVPNIHGYFGCGRSGKCKSSQGWSYAQDLYLMGTGFL